MNLYDLHANPEKLSHFEKRYEIPQIAYDEAKEFYRKTGLRFLEIEPGFAKDPKLAYVYAVEVIKDRFPEGEPAIAKDPNSKKSYESYFKVTL